ncbi:hypothetical protein L1987_39321 [Smallanthus sonchifolius]|uniref:Uncharacterized protein n=1 Tax=Smallanthus sonchifolius TaxID=185202 RepID=A0ACB9HL22_9ASTR|nr:hypothetical protein L1987_39321 [Smallanthus sonchifolius]
MGKRYEELNDRLDGIDGIMKELGERMKVLLASAEMKKNPNNGFGGGLDDEDKTTLFHKKSITFLDILYSFCNPFSCFSFPNNFEDFVVGHFRNRAVDIMKAYEAYSEGVQVGCLVKDVPQRDNKGTFSTTFNDDLDSCIKTLIVEFERIGAKVDETSML